MEFIVMYFVIYLIFKKQEGFLVILIYLFMKMVQFFINIGNILD